jgi:hypothetical protein
MDNDGTTTLTIADVDMIIRITKSHEKDHFWEMIDSVSPLLKDGFVWQFYTGGAFSRYTVKGNVFRYEMREQGDTKWTGVVTVKGRGSESIAYNLPFPILRRIWETYVKDKHQQTKT